MRSKYTVAAVFLSILSFVLTILVPLGMSPVTKYTFLNKLTFTLMANNPITLPFLLALCSAALFLSALGIKDTRKNQLKGNTWNWIAFNLGVITTMMIIMITTLIHFIFGGIKFL